MRSTVIFSVALLLLLAFLYQPTAAAVTVDNSTSASYCCCPEEAKVFQIFSIKRTLSFAMKVAFAQYLFDALKPRFSWGEILVF